MSTSSLMETSPSSGISPTHRTQAMSTLWRGLTARREAAAPVAAFSLRANWSIEGGLVPHVDDQRLHVPLDAPNRLLNRITVGAFNQLYHAAQSAEGRLAPATLQPVLPSARRYCQLEPPVWTKGLLAVSVRHSKAIDEGGRCRIPWCHHSKRAGFLPYCAENIRRSSITRPSVISNGGGDPRPRFL